MIPDAYRPLLGRTSLIGHVTPLLRQPGSPRLFFVSSTPAQVSTYLGRDVVGQTGAVGFTNDEAATCAIGEAVERYCCAFYDHDSLVHATAQELGSGARPLSTWSLFHPKQMLAEGFPFARREDLPIHWSRAESLHDGTERFVPASLVYIPYNRRDPSDRHDMIAPAVSSGFACHPDRERALLTGLCEVVERDAFVITWLRKLPPRRIDGKADPVLGPLLERYFASESLELHLFDITVDIAIPTVLCVGRGTSVRGAFACVGAATRPSIRDAAIKAMKEACQGAAWVRGLVREDPTWLPQPGFRDILEFEDHVRLYGVPEMVSQLDFLFDTPHHAGPLNDGPSEPLLPWALEQVRRAGLEAVAVDATAPEIALHGLHVPKVMVPGTVPLTSMHHLPPLGVPRLWSVPSRLGRADEVLPGFNPIPHPFP